MACRTAWRLGRWQSDVRPNRYGTGPVGIGRHRSLRPWMKRFVLTGPAQRDLEEIRNYLLDRAGPPVARRVLPTIRRSVELIATEPGMGHVRRDLTGRPLKFWPVYSYLVV